MKNLKSDDWYELKKVARTRLGPNEISGWFAASLMYSLVILGTSIFGCTQIRDLNKEFWMPIMIVATIFVIIQLIIGIFFSNMRNVYDHQKIEAVCLSITATKLSIDGYLFFFMLADENMIEKSVINIFILVALAGIILMIISTIRGIKRVKQGHFREGGDGLYDFKNSKGYISFVGVYSVVILVTILCKVINNYGNNIMKVIIVLIPLLVVQYGVSIAIPEFYLLTYCKFKYDEFIIPVPKGHKELYNRQLKVNKKSKNKKIKVKK